MKINTFLVALLLCSFFCIEKLCASSQSSSCQKSLTSPALDHQANGIEAINEGNIANFVRWVQADGDLQTPNSEGFTPYRYLELLTKKPAPLNRNKIVHQKMLKIADEHLLTQNLTTMFITIKTEKKDDQH
jgi:hypothetical protein